LELRLRAALCWVIAAGLAFAVTALAGDKKEKPKASSSQTVDSGSFGVFVKGQRVVTEVFHVQQQNGNSNVKAQLKEAAGSVPIDQKSDLEITGNGELLHYEWSEGGPEGGSLTVLPKDEFLIEKITAASTGKLAEQPFLMPNTSMILDNNFFVHREVLAWRYLAAACHPESGNLQCQKGPVEFGVLVPQDRSSVRVRMELVGKEKVPIRGTERELIRLNLTGEGFEWALWVDGNDQFKLIRIAIPADSTEVVRD
jgi:hypothetical protein